jgi:protein TonB
MFQFTEPEVVDEPETPPVNVQEDDKKIGAVTQDGDDEDAPEVIAPTVQQDVEEKEEEVLQFAEEMPQFKGGEAAFQKYLVDNIRYPQMEKEQGKEGTVYVYFEVAKDGTVGNVKTVKGVPGAPGLQKEAERVIKSMPPWEPGKMNGRNVKVAQTVPVKFVLQ